jgi:type I restriction enzyme, S subunit
MISNPRKRGRESTLLWPIVRLADVADIVAGQSPPGSTYRRTPQGLPFFQGKTDFGPRHPVARMWCVEPTRVAEPGDILISVRAPVGPTNVADARCCIGRGLAAIRPHLSLERDFLLQFLQLREPSLSALGSGSTFAAITRRTLDELRIPLPSLSEQKRISAGLNEQFATMERARQAAAEKHKAATALTLAYVMREFGTAEARAWPRRRLKSLILGNGQYGTSQKSHYVAEGGAVPVLGISNLKGGRVVWDRLKYTVLSVEDWAKYRLDKDDMLFCRTNSADLVGESAVFEGGRDAAFASYLVRFRLNPELAEARFVSTCINSPLGRHFIQQNLGRAIGQANVSASVVAEMEIPTPSVTVQRGVVRRLMAAGVKVARLCHDTEGEFGAIERVPSALLRVAFAGAA